MFLQAGLWTDGYVERAPRHRCRARGSQTWASDLVRKCHLQCFVICALFDLIATRVGMLGLHEAPSEITVFMNTI